MRLRALIFQNQGIFFARFISETKSVTPNFFGISDKSKKVKKYIYIRGFSRDRPGHRLRAPVSDDFHRERGMVNKSSDICDCIQDHYLNNPAV